MATTEATTSGERVQAGVAAAAPRRRLYRRFREQILPRIVLVGMSILFLAPLYWMLISALKTNRELATFPPGLIPHSWVFGNFIDAINFIPFALYAFNSFIITLGVTIGSVLSNTLVAYGFSRIRWPGREPLFYVCMATLFLPFPVLIVGLFDIFAGLGWVDTYLPIIVPAFFANPFYIFLMRQFMLTIPRELSDAARVDGANELQVFWRVILPLTRPAVVVVAIFAAVAAWNEFLLPLLYLQSEEKYTLAIGLAFFRSTHDVAFNLLMAASTLVVLPVVIVFVLAQRFFVEGITVGGVKG